MVKSVQALFVLLVLSIGTISLTTKSSMAPPGPVGPYLNNIFPKSTPGANGAWGLEDAYPDLGIVAPVRIISFPGSTDILVLSKIGEVWRVSLAENTKRKLLDIKDRSFKKGEAGTVGMVLHPEFGNPSSPEKQYIYVFYRTKPDPDVWDEKGFNRLSKFKWNESDQTFDPDSEEILIQQYDRHTWHNGGGMFFGPDGFLYISLGDEGSDGEEGVIFQMASSQTLKNGLFSGVIRIDVDNDPTKSHPIRRQPIANATPPAGWWPTYSQGYGIPNDNPWLSPDSSALEEFYAVGLRSPHSMSYDPEEEQIWIADVGSNIKEEINKVDREDNLQWPYMQGRVPSEEHEKPDPYIGNEREVYYQIDREDGNCVIGGGVYRGDLFPDLKGKYLYADYGKNKILALTSGGTGLEPSSEVIISNLGGQPITLPEKYAITGVHPQPDGEILITIVHADFSPAGLETSGAIVKLVSKEVIPDPPALLSELAVFEDLENLVPVSGIIPYKVNAPLWSDGALKKRWIAIPNDGTLDSKNEKINFSGTTEWEFPVGTVFIKHFDLPVSDDGTTAKLETRFFIIGEQGIGYGLTYKWNEAGTDAVLVGSGGSSEDFDIYENGNITFTQTWDYPSRDQCMSCHTDVAKYVLGVKTHQLNSDLYYPSTGQTMNQLEYLNGIGAFYNDIGKAKNYPKAFAIDDESADLELRVRSYLDSNCSSCHRIGGLPSLNLNLRFSVPLPLTNMVNMEPLSNESDINNKLVWPGDHSKSELWLRDASISNDRMPPIAKTMVDEKWVAVLAEWIDQLSVDAGEIKEFFLYPNPSDGWINIRLSDQWNGPFEFQVRDISGKLVTSFTSDSPIASVDLNGQPAGIYLLEVVAGEERELKKFMLY